MSKYLLAQAPWRIESFGYESFVVTEVGTQVVQTCTYDRNLAALIAEVPTMIRLLKKSYQRLESEYPESQWEEHYPEIIEIKNLLQKIEQEEL